MSRYQSKKSPFWQYDFVLKGRRFHGSTGVATRRAAEAVERKLRVEAAEGRLDEAARMTLDLAAGKWWAERGKDRGDASDVERRLGTMLKMVGKDRLLSEITTKVVSDAIQRRRGVGYTRAPGKDAKVYLPSNATVNRDIVEMLRPILRRAKTHWGAQGLPEIAWNELSLSEPPETFRYYTQAEREAWLAECDEVCAFALELMLTYGLRYGELFFKLSQFDPEGPRLRMMKGRKLKVPHLMPLLAEHGRIIAARISQARENDLDTIWFVPEGRELVALTYYGLKARLYGAAARAGIEPGRIIHGARHHAGTAMLRKTDNLKLTQKLLGHKDISSTMRYVHAMEADLRAALEQDDPKSRTRNNGGRKIQQHQLVVGTYHRLPKPGVRSSSLLRDATSRGQRSRRAQS